MCKPILQPMPMTSPKFIWNCGSGFDFFILFYTFFLKPHPPRIFTLQIFVGFYSSFYAYFRLFSYLIEWPHHNLYLLHVITKVDLRKKKGSSLTKKKKKGVSNWKIDLNYIFDQKKKKKKMDEKLVFFCFRKGM